MHSHCTSVRPHGYVQTIFGYINAYITALRTHKVLYAFLAHPCMIRALLAQTTVRAHLGVGAATHAWSRPSITKNLSACRPSQEHYCILDPNHHAVT